MDPKKAQALIAAGRKKQDELEAVKAERKAALRDRLTAARRVQVLKARQRDVIRQKVAAGQPITQEEGLALLSVTSRRANSVADRKKRAIFESLAPTLMIKPRSVNELRLLIEKTAQEGHYNPMAALMEIANDKDTDIKDRISIHKTLLPFIMPTIAPAKPEQINLGTEDGGVRVKVVSMTFPAGGAPVIQITQDARNNSSSE